MTTTTIKALEQIREEREALRGAERDARGTCNNCGKFGTIGEELHGVLRSLTSRKGTESMFYVLCEECEGPAHP